MTARTPAPKAEDYSVVPGSLGPRRDFRISVGLREGWDAEGRVFDVSEAVRTARAWMKRRVEAGQPALSGMFTRAEVTYAWPRPDGTVGSVFAYDIATGKQVVKQALPYPNYAGVSLTPGLHSSKAPLQLGLSLRDLQR